MGEGAGGSLYYIYIFLLLGSCELNVLPIQNSK